METDELDVVLKAMRSPPVDAEKVIRELGISYKSLPLSEDVSGYIEHDNGHFTIAVNDRDSPQLQRFVAAHELGHYLWHREILADFGDPVRHVDSTLGDYSKDNPTEPFAEDHETRADRFAIEFLMSGAVVTSSYDPDTDNVDEVAKLFAVSSDVMKTRLRMLDLRGDEQNFQHGEAAG